MVADIICVLYPHSESAREEVMRLAKEGSPHIIGKMQADDVEPDYNIEDDASRFTANQGNQGDHAIILRLSSKIKDPRAGFTFGRNASRCDIIFLDDPLKRVSNIHFRIYANEYGNVMIADQSTNGTQVDNQILQAKSKDPRRTPMSKYLLSSGALIRISLHDREHDLVFRVRIPRRAEEYEAAYTAKVDEYFARYGIPRSDAVITSPEGHPDLFRKPTLPVTQRQQPVTQTQDTPQVRSSAGKAVATAVRSEWNGSGKYNKVQSIGKGAFAVVYKVTAKYDGKPYAAKELEKRRFIKNGVLDEKVENEMKIMQRINHQHIVRYIENFEWDNRLLIIIMEYVPGGDLGKLVQDHGPLNEENGKLLSMQLLSALGYLHTNNITHRDVKPDNILINSLDPLDVKLTDFGLSKIIDSEQTFLRTFCGTLLYCAPEVYTEYIEYDDNGHRIRGKPVRRIPGQRYSHAVDVWSLGGVLFYSLTGSPPYPVKGGISHSELLHRIMTSMLNVAPLQAYRISFRGIDFIGHMLQRRPENRATVLDLQGHLWLQDLEEAVQASQSYDEITDDEEFTIEPSQFRQGYDDDRVNESLEDDSDQENETFVPTRTSGARLFGEVGSSAIGSSGAIPSEYLNLPVGDVNMGRTEFLDATVDEAYDSCGSGDCDARSTRHFTDNPLPSMFQRQSMDELQSLVKDVASQSLGGEPQSDINDANASRQSIFSLDPNTSKRKPPSQETIEDYDENTPPSKPTIKRFKSEGNLDEPVSEQGLTEYKLLASVPEIRRSKTGRIMDFPVGKRAFWGKDKETWHLNYPEMMELQWGAFKSAVAARGEVFRSGETPLWDIAMKYFPPVPRPELLSHFTSLAASAFIKVNDDLPGTEIHSTTMDGVIAPGAVEHRNRIVPINETGVPSRAIALIESTESSSLGGISLPITDSLLSFGRGPENTQIYANKQEQKVPKYAFKILLWKNDNSNGKVYEPSQDPSKVMPPWQDEASPVDADDYSFWISTKATSGIWINKQPLPSSKLATTSYWTRIFDGDRIVLTANLETNARTQVVFQCFWGGSSKNRQVAVATSSARLELAQPALAQKLDRAAAKTERRIDRQRVVELEMLECSIRGENPAPERQRSEVFEAKRKDAIRILAARKPLSTRRLSPVTAE